MSTQHDAIIIGAGMGGLASAITLASEGKRVHVVEALPRAGGKMGIAEHDGARFDTGPSILTLRDVLDTLMERAGTTLEAELELMSASPLFRYVYPDGTVLDVEHELEATLANVRDTLGPVAAEELRGFLEYSRDIWEAARPNFIEGDAPRFGSVFKLGMTRFRQVMKIDPLHTMWQGIERRVQNQHLRWLLMRYATYNGSSPFLAPATLNCIAWVELGLGGWGVRGGMEQIPVALQRVAERLGVTFAFNTRVSQIRTDRRGRVAGVTLEDGARLDAQCVVANADAAHVVHALLDRGATQEIPAPETCSMSGWTAILRARTPEHGGITTARAAHTVLFPEDYEAEFEDIFDRDRPPQDPTVYLCAQDLNHGRPGWDDAAPVFLMANAPCEPERGQRDPAVYEALQARVVERVREAGLMAEADELVWTRTPAELAATFPGSRGSIYGAASNSQTSAFRRPPNRVRDVPGLYLASGSAHPGGGVPLCLMSGQTAALAALEDQPVRKRRANRAVLVNAKRASWLS